MIIIFQTLTYCNKQHRNWYPKTNNENPNSSNRKRTKFDQQNHNKKPPDNWKHKAKYWMLNLHPCSPLEFKEAKKEREREREESEVHAIEWIQSQF